MLTDHFVVSNEGETTEAVVWRKRVGVQIRLEVSVDSTYDVDDRLRGLMERLIAELEHDVFSGSPQQQ